MSGFCSDLIGSGVETEGTGRGGTEMAEKVSQLTEGIYTPFFKAKIFMAQVNGHRTVLYGDICVIKIDRHGKLQ